jgi:hypothetical protein
MRTIYLNSGLDDWIKQRAVQLNTSNSEVLRQYLEKGIAFDASSHPTTRVYSELLRYVKNPAARKAIGQPGHKTKGMLVVYEGSVAKATSAARNPKSTPSAIKKTLDLKPKRPLSSVKKVAAKKVAARKVAKKKP